jgi:DNA-binding response OmpR family regulator
MSARILIVDDAQELTGMLKSTFEKRGFRVSIARSCDEALPILREQKPDVMILDHSLSGDKQGIDLLFEKRRDPRLKNVKVILSSGKLIFPHAWFKESGDNMDLTKEWIECVGKPYSMEEMINAVLRAVDETPPENPPVTARMLDAGAAAARRGRSDSAPISEGKQGQPRILIVEDDEVSGFSVMEKLRGLGYGAGWCMNRKTMNQFIKPGDKLPFDILILDLALPDAFGSDILRDLAKDPRSKGLRVIIITGHLGPDEETSYRNQLEPEPRALLAKIMIKPYKLSDLVKEVEYAAEERTSGD